MPSHLERDNRPIIPDQVMKYICVSQILWTTSAACMATSAPPDGEALQRAGGQRPSARLLFQPGAGDELGGEPRHSEP